MTTQRLQLGALTQQREAPMNTPTYLAGRRMYAIGAVGGGIVPFGDEHIVGKMGGIWAHPWRVLAGWRALLIDSTGTRVLDHADECVQAWSHIERRWQGAVDVTWCEWIAPAAPIAYVELRLHNNSSERWQGAIQLSAQFDIRACWFGGVELGPTQIRTTDDGVQASPGDWTSGPGAALGSAPAPSQCSHGGSHAYLSYAIELAPDQQRQIVIALVAEHTGGAERAQAQLADALAHADDHRQQQLSGYQHVLSSGVQFHSPDAQLNSAWSLAKVNLHALEAEYPPALGRYFLAGLPEYPQFFGCDTTYTVPGAVAAGFRDTSKSALEQLAQVAWQQCGRVPHELTTNGRIFNSGNLQETPQFVLAVWDYVCWSGDRDFLERMYPRCREGLIDYVLQAHSWQGTPYLWGDGMVERTGMGIFKLDVQCYAIAALHTLATMAQRLGRTSEAAQYRAKANTLHQALEAEWWLSDAGMYADSRHSDGQLQLDGHWTVILPVQLGIAAPHRAAQVLDNVLRGYVNQWGLMHTRERDERVWTLPTGLLVLALCRHGHMERAVQYLKAIAATSDSGILGALEELIPAGLCFVQLWSAGLLLEGVLSGVAGVRPDALEHRINLDPQLPPTWERLALTDLHIGAHRIDLSIEPAALEIHHHHGDQPLTVSWRQHQTSSVAPGDRIRLNTQEQRL